MPEQPKELIVLLNHAARIMVLVPKRHQSGFLKTPAGHHRTPLIDFINDELGCDVFGLEGHLALDVPARVRKAEDLVNDYVVPLAKFLGYSFRLVAEDEFFKWHPNNYVPRSRTP